MISMGIVRFDIFEKHPNIIIFEWVIQDERLKIE